MKTVLIVEDEKMIRQGIRTMIQRSGVPTEVIMECSNGEMALEILKNQKVDVMFTDIRMPKIDGIELVRKINTLENKPLIVVISGYADFTYAVEMLRSGVKDYILKPVEREKIQEVLLRLDKEIKENQVSSQNSKRLGIQQLKYMMLNEHITDEELETLQTEYENNFNLDNYFICAVNPDELEEVKDRYIYLNNIAENDIFLVSEKNLELLLKNELEESYVGVSAGHSGIKELKQAYDEAVDARHRAFCSNQKVVRFAEAEKRVPEVLQSEAAKLVEPESRLQRVQLLGTDKTEEIMKVWNIFFNAVKKERIKPNVFKECMDSFFHDVKKTYRNILTDDMDIVKQFCDLYLYDKIDDYEADFMEWVMALHDRINSQFDTNKNKQKIRLAMDYIQENYDKDLNMAVVSNHISMNYSLFSYLFKEYAGSNFVNYLKGIRMEEAKKLLTETDMRIIEISQQVGYDNEKHFMKTFKASVGVSPSEYRKNTSLR